MTVPADRVDRIRQLVQDALRPQRLEIWDDSVAHAGHASAGDKGHFRMRVVSGRFSGLRPLERHRLVQQLLAPLYDTDIHALSLETLTPNEDC